MRIIYKTKLLLFLMIFSSSSVFHLSYAQVTIGSNTPPNKGSLLDLKESEVSEANSTKGLILPRVKLQLLNPDSDASFAKSMGVDGEEWDRLDHIGLLVYNVGGCTEKIYSPEGVYVWNKSEWQPLVPIEQDIDVRKISYSGTNQFTMQYKNEEETYYYASFGNAGIWMTQNLRTRYAPDGTALVMSDSNNSFAYPSSSGNPDNATDFTNNRAIGLLYNWQTAAVESKNCNITRGLCPTGWHLPTDSEWTLLEKEITAHSGQYATATISTYWDPAWESRTSSTGWQGEHGYIMKSTTKVYSGGSATGGVSKAGTAGGFDGYLTGLATTNRTKNEHFAAGGYFWSSSPSSSGYSWSRGISNSATNTKRVLRTDHYPTNYYLSVRCKKDE